MLKATSIIYLEVNAENVHFIQDQIKDLNSEFHSLIRIVAPFMMKLQQSLTLDITHIYCLQMNNVDQSKA